jgi:hypothetical protein
MTAKGSLAANHAARGAGIIQQLFDLVGCEADEPEQVTLLNGAIDAVNAWIVAERSEVGSPDDAAAYQAYYGPSVKAWQQEMKAEPLDGSKLDSWLGGKIPRRLLMVPFGGPLPGGKAGLDLDGEYFHEGTDLFGPFPLLRSSRDRLVDWHHDNDPTKVMKGAILGRVVMDAAPEADGMWADFWVNAGEKRKALIATLERRGVQLYGSSQAIPTAVRKASDGAIDVWPVIRHTITTSPQNTLAVVPALKALLTSGLPSEATSKAALEAAVLGMDEGPSRSTAPVGSAPIDADLPPDVKAKLDLAIDGLAAYVRSLT